LTFSAAPALEQAGEIKDDARPGQPDQDDLPAKPVESEISGFGEEKPLPYWLSSVVVPPVTPDTGEEIGGSAPKTGAKDEVPAWLKGFTSSLAKGENPVEEIPTLLAQPVNPPTAIDTPVPDWLLQDARQVNNEITGKVPDAVAETAVPSTGDSAGREPLKTFLYHGIELPYWLEDIYPPDGLR
jgi:hypothetical protein